MKNQRSMRPAGKSSLFSRQIMHIYSGIMHKYAYLFVVFL